jgi:Heparinase II/III-like protein/Heparinase II/III N-terminus
MRTFQERFVWYYRRLSSMSAPEIVHRSIEVVAKQVARWRSHGWDKINTIGPLASLPTPNVRELASSSNIAELVARQANDVRAGCFHLLGARWPNPPAMPFPPHFWHVDPDDGEPFPQRDAYCFDISFRHGVGTREIKRIWELNRLQYLVPLAVDAMITSDQRSKDLVIGLILSWMDGNKPFRGLSWVFGIELALRIISVALALSIIGTESLPSAVRASMLRFFFAHVDWIKRFPSLYSSANNHRIAELVGLIVGTTMAPGIPDAAAIREDSWRSLLVEIDRQILPDGVGAEQSLGYTAFSIELFLLAATAIGRNRNLPKATTDRLSAWAEYSLWLSDTDGRLPAIGDFDDCRVIATTQAPESRYIASILAAVADCIGRQDLAPPAKDSGIRDLLLGSAGTFSNDRVGMRSFLTGGYSVLRSMGKTPAVLTIDHGPIGYLAIAAHGHADALAIWLSVGNQPIIVDAGTYLYHSNRILRDTFRQTAVHNTLILDDVSSSRPSGPFNWATKANSRLIASAHNPSSRIVAEHDGYALKYGVIHRRTVEYDGVACFTIVDEFLGATTEETVAVSFLLDPTCQSALEPDGMGVVVTRNAISIARLANAGELKARIVRGDDKLGLGWVSPSFGIRVPADQILFEGTLRRSSTIQIEIF